MEDGLPNFGSSVLLRGSLLQAMRTLKLKFIESCNQISVLFWQEIAVSY